MSEYSLSFPVGMSAEKTQAVINKAVQDWQGSQVNYTGSIFGGLGSSSYSTSYKEPSFGEMLWGGLKSTLMGGVAGFMQMGMQMMMMRMFAGMFGGGGGAAAADGAGTPARTSAVINEEITSIRSEIAQKKAEYARLEKEMKSGSEEKKAELDDKAKKLFGGKDTTMEHVPNATAEGLKDKEKLANKLSELWNQRLKLKDEISANSTAIKEHAENIIGLNSSISAKRPDVKNKKEIYETLKGQVDALEKKLNAATDQEKASIQDKLNTLTPQADIAKTNYEEAKRQLEEDETKLEQEQRLKGEKEKANETKNVELDNCNKAIDDLKKDSSGNENKDYDTVFAQVQTFESEKRAYQTNCTEKAQKIIQKDMDDLSKEISALEDKLKTLNAELKKVSGVEANQTATTVEENKAKDDAAMAYAKADYHDSNAWQRGWFSSRADKATLKLSHQEKTEQAGLAGGSAEAETRFLRQVNEELWDSSVRGQYKLNDEFITRQQFNRTFNEISYGKIRDAYYKGENKDTIKTLIQNELKKAGFTSTSS